MTKKSKKIILGIVIGTIITVMLLLMILAIYTGFSSDRSETESNPSSQTAFIVKSLDDKLAVYYMGERDPIKVYDFYITSLPETDANRIKDGIIVYDQVELQQLLEDFIS